MAKAARTRASIEGDAPGSVTLRTRVGSTASPRRGPRSYPVVLPLRLCAWLALVAPLAATSARAQPREETTDADLQEARARFVAGRAAVESGRWADAVDDFRRAYELSGVPAALYNVGFALRALGRYREARDVFDRLLTRHADLEPDLRQEASRYRDEAAARVVALRLSGLEPDLRYAIRFDGDRVEDDGRRPIEIEGDPGTHAVTVRLEGHEPFVWEGELADGERRSVPVELVPLRPGSGEEGDEGSGLLASPVFWIVVGAVVLGGAAVTGLLLHDAAQLDPNSDRVYEL